MTWDIILAGMIGGLGFGLFCVSMQTLWMMGPPPPRVGQDRPGDDDVYRIVAWCQQKIDDAVRERDMRWIRRVLK